MKKFGSARFKALLYIALLAAMAFSALQLYAPKAGAKNLACCNWGNECTRFAICCQNPIMAPCSATKRDYCQVAC
jgi:hypothetical protein